MIWKFSLPGQRVLTASCGNRRTGLLNFYEKNNPYNPTLLSVCRESRYVALKHYRLCFGTTNIYADLSLDILYFGNNWHHQVLGPGYNVCNWETWSKSKNQRIPTKMNAAVMADLEKITHLAILSRLWRYRNPGRRGSTGADLRIDAMSTFPNLKQLTIVTREAADSSGTPGYIEFTPDKTQTWESVCWKEFSTYQLSDAEKVKGVPGIQVVSASSTSHIPGDDWNRDYGEPFVSVPPSVKFNTNCTISSILPS
ncbi:hypothetical protein N431DRAFT_85401 [Stipitochalara longipes BDJ]|nr:hypothetical protein N431DRAFT_85401 [Stipitochalara longipes BDJ]